MVARTTAFWAEQYQESTGALRVWEANHAGQGVVYRGLQERQLNMRMQRTQVAHLHRLLLFLGPSAIECLCTPAVSIGKQVHLMGAYPAEYLPTQLSSRDGFLGLFSHAFLPIGNIRQLCMLP